MAAEVRCLPGDTGVADIIETLDADGVAIVRDFVAPDWLEGFNTEIQPAVDKTRKYVFGTDQDEFLGDRTVRLQGLIAEAPSYAELMINERLLALMDHYLLPYCSRYLFSAGELIEIRSGETAQPFHVDDSSWPVWARAGAKLLQVNVMLAGTDFTATNGATLVVPGSHLWEEEREPADHEIAQAVMPAGSVAIIRGDCAHAGGANTDGARRRAISVSYCLGWLRTVENSFLNLPLDVVARLPVRARELLGYEVYDGSGEENSGILGYYGMGSPRALFDD